MSCWNRPGLAWGQSMEKCLKGLRGHRRRCRWLSFAISAPSSAITTGRKAITKRAPRQSGSILAQHGQAADFAAFGPCLRSEPGFHSQRFVGLRKSLFVKLGCSLIPRFYRRTSRTAFDGRTRANQTSAMASRQASGDILAEQFIVPPRSTPFSGRNRPASRGQ